MTEFSNTNRGTLGKNKNPKSKKSPEYTGSLNVNGVDYWVSGWVQVNSKTGEKFFSLAVNLKEEQSEKVSTQNVEPEYDDSIPF